VSRKSEADFVNEGLSVDELAALNGADDQGGAPVADDQSSGGTVVADDGQQPQQPQPAADDTRTVDIRALQEARANERALREELARNRETQARLDERLTMLNEAFQRQQNPEPKAPTKDEDPLAYYDHELTSVSAELKAMKEAQAAREEAERNAAAEQAEREAIWSRASTVYEAAKAKHTDVDDAMHAAIQGAQAEIGRRIQAGMMRPEHAQAALQSHVQEWVRQAPANPDDFANYCRAHARFWGWNGTQAPAQQQASVSDLAARQERHMSLSGTSGGEPPKALDAKSLAEMSDKDFQALMQTVNGRKQISAIMGE
jgi:hypothetical protein